MKLRYARGALADLDDIFRYIAKDNPSAAARLIDRIEQVAGLIVEQPYIGVATGDRTFVGFRRESI